MHELSICLALMQQVERIGAEHGARGVATILLRVGPLSGVEPPLLERAFPLAATGTIAEDAALIIEQTGVRVRCEECGEESDAAPNRLLCGRCGEWRTRLVSGDEMLLASLELDFDDTPAKGPVAADAAAIERPPP